VLLAKFALLKQPRYTWSSRKRFLKQRFLSVGPPALLFPALAMWLYKRSSIWKSEGKKMSAVPGGSK